MKRSSNVLEVGCGIGTVSKLIIKATPEGQFLGCDISSKSIEFARKFNPESHANFQVTDMSKFTSDLRFDFIVFPDVLEHIPAEQHANIFSKIAAVSKPSTKILINIPEPNALNSVRKYNPELLQIIDQSLSLQKLVNDAAESDFKLESVEPYAIHTEVDNYLKIVFYRERELKPVKLNNKVANLIQNIKVKYF